MTSRTRARRLAATVALTLTTGLLAGTGISGASAAPAKVEPSTWPTLAAALQPVIDDAERRGVEMGLFVADLDGAFGGARLHLGEQGRFTTASTIKLSLAATVMHQVESGTLSLEDVVTLQPADLVGGSGVLKNNPFPQDVTVGRMLDLMITVSDNTATNKLVDVVGGHGPINALSQDAGIAKEDLHFGRKMFGAIVLPDGDIWATPAGFEQLLDLFYATAEGSPNAGFLSVASAEHILALMQRQQVKTKLGAAVPPGVVAHKTGENDTVSHDLGYFLIPGRDLAIGVFTRNERGYASAAWAAIAEPYVQKVAALVYAEQLRGATPMRSTTKLTLSKKRQVKGKKPVTAKVTVRAAVGTPTGKVLVRVGGKKVALVTLKAGVAAVRLPKRLAVGNQRIAVSYQATNRFAYAASSATAALKVTKR